MFSNESQADSSPCLEWEVNGIQVQVTQHRTHQLTRHSVQPAQSNGTARARGGETRNAQANRDAGSS